MQRNATATDLRRNLGKLLNQLRHRGDSIVVTRGGKPVAALVDHALYERIRSLRKSFAALTDEIGEAYANVPAETAEAEISAAVRHVRRGRSR